MASIFKFMNRNRPVRYQIDSAAETYLFRDLNAFMCRPGLSGERNAEEIYRQDDEDEALGKNIIGDRAVRGDDDRAGGGAGACGEG